MDRNDGQLAHISAARPLERKAAWELVFKALPSNLQQKQVDLMLRQANAGLLDLEGLIVARNGDDMVGAIWVQQLPGSTAAIWFPQRLPGGPPSLARLLWEASDAYLEVHNVRLAQCLVELDSGAEAEILHAAGYKRSVDLLYLVSTRDSFPESPPAKKLQFERFQRGAERRLKNVIEQTYRETLDCPALAGIRSMEDIVAGYRATGDTSSTHWYFVCDKMEDVGCLLLTNHSKDLHWELIYVGLVPAARGKAWGLEATRYAQWLTGEAGSDRLVLVVDAANHPALKMYASAGFIGWDRRSVFLKVFSGTTATSNEIEKLSQH